MNPETQREIDAAIDMAKWDEVETSTVGIPDLPAGTVCYKGTALDWLLVIVSFSIEDQGFPKGAMGYDGVARRSHSLIRLTREQAIHAYAKARLAPFEDLF